MVNMKTRNPNSKSHFHTTQAIPRNAPRSANQQAGTRKRIKQVSQMSTSINGFEASRKSTVSAAGNAVSRHGGQRYNTKMDQYNKNTMYDSIGTDSIDEHYEHQTTIEGRTRHTNGESQVSQQSMNNMMKGKIFRKRDASIHTSMGDA